MKSSFRVTTLSIAILLCSGGSLRAAIQAGEPAPPPVPAEGTYEAECFLKVSWDPGILPLTEESIGWLAEHAGKEAVAEILDVPFHQTRDNALFLVFQTTGSIFNEGALVAKLKFRIRPTDRWDLPPVADELVAATREGLRAAVEQVNDNELRALHAQIERAQAERARAEQRVIRLQELRAQLSESAGRNDLSREDIVAEVRNLQNAQHELELALAQQRAVRRSLEEEIARIGRKTEEQAKEDPIAVELEKVVELRNFECERHNALVQAYQATPNEGSELEERLALAKVQLAQHRMEMAQRAGAGRLEELNNELAAVAIETTGLEGRLQWANERLEHIRAGRLLDLADRYEREVGLQFPLAASALAAAIERCDELENRLSNAQPAAVTVLDAAPEAEEPAK